MARERRKARTGRVVGDRMDKTVVVSVEWRQRHLLYKKSLRRVTRFYAHDGQNTCKVGDLVRIEETRPISRLKRWRVTSILERRDVVEVKPIELDQMQLEEKPEADGQEISVEEARDEEVEEVEE